MFECFPNINIITVITYICMLCIRIEESKEKDEMNHFPLVEEKKETPSLSDIIHAL